MSNRLRISLLFVLIAIASLLSGCNTSIAQEYSTSAATNAENEIPAGTDGKMREDEYKTNSNLENLGDSPDLKLFSETIEQLQDEMAPFAFKAYCRDGHDDFISDLHIVNTETNESVGDFCLIDYMVFWDVPKGIPDEYYEIELIDVDFDGYKDIRIFAGFNGLWRKDYIYFIWDPDTGKFTGDKYGLRDLGLPGFDAEKQLVHSMVRASAADHWFYTHRYIGGELVTIEEVSINCVWENWLDDSAWEKVKAIEPLYDPDTTTFMHFMIEQLDFERSVMVVGENKFQLYDTSRMREETLLVEYDFDSELGLLFRELLGGVELPPHKLETKKK